MSKPCFAGRFGERSQRVQFSPTIKTERLQTRGRDLDAGMHGPKDLVSRSNRSVREAAPSAQTEILVIAVLAQRRETISEAVKRLEGLHAVPPKQVSGNHPEKHELGVFNF